jgi:tetratricopeptide (TPR) repeat protein
MRTRTALAAPLSAALAASLIASIFDAAALAPVLLTQLVLSALIGLEPPGPVPRFALKRAVAAIPFCAVLAVCVSAFTIALAVSDFNLAAFQRAPTPSTRDAVLRWEMPGTAEDIYCSRILLNQCQTVTGMTDRLECWRQAEQVAARATKTAGDTASAWYNLALFTAVQNDARGTRIALTRASEIAPNWFKPHWTLAKLLSQTGDINDAEIEAARAVSLNANHDPEVTQTLQQIRAAFHR